MAGGRTDGKRFWRKGLVGLNQAQQQGEEAGAQTQTQRDAQDDGEDEKEEFHGWVRAPFFSVEGASVSRPPALEARSGRGII